jgi:Zn-dependent protease with chaperone function
MLEWQGEGAFFDGQTSKREPVQILINAHGISMRKEGEWDFSPLGKCSVMRRSKPGHLSIEPERFSGAEIILYSAEAEAALTANGFLQARLLSGMPKKTKFALMTGGLLLLLFLLFKYGIDFIIDRGLLLVSDEMEAKLGSMAFNELAPSRQRLEGDAVREVLEKCASVIQTFDSSHSWKIEIAVVDDEKTKNAFALPGGYIVIYRGILGVMENENELFGLLAHEAGHVYLRHGLRRIARTAMIGVMVSVLFGDASGLSAVLVDNSEVLLNLAYDRKEERAADEYALAALHQAGINRRGLVTLFEQIKEEEGDAGIPAFLSTHPATAERIAYLQRGASGDNSSRTILSAEEWELLTGAKQP